MKRNEAKVLTYKDSNSVSQSLAGVWWRTATPVLAHVTDPQTPKVDMAPGDIISRLSDLDNTVPDIKPPVPTTPASHDEALMSLNPCLDPRTFGFPSFSAPGSITRCVGRVFASSGKQGCPWPAVWCSNSREPSWKVCDISKRQMSRDQSDAWLLDIPKPVLCLLETASWK